MSSIVPLVRLVKGRQFVALVIGAVVLTVIRRIPLECYQVDAYTAMVVADVITINTAIVCMTVSYCLGVPAGSLSALQSARWMHGAGIFYALQAMPWILLGAYAGTFGSRPLLTWAGLVLGPLLVLPAHYLIRSARLRGLAVIIGGCASPFPLAYGHGDVGDFVLFFPFVLTLPMLVIGAMQFRIATDLPQEPPSQRSTAASPLRRPVWTIILGIVGVPVGAAISVALVLLFFWVNLKLEPPEPGSMGLEGMALGLFICALVAAALGCFWGPLVGIRLGRRLDASRHLRVGHESIGPSRRSR